MELLDERSRRKYSRPIRQALIGTRMMLGAEARAEGLLMRAMCDDDYDYLISLTDRRCRDLYSCRCSAAAVAAVGDAVVVEGGAEEGGGEGFSRERVAWRQALDLFTKDFFFSCTS